MTVAAETRDLAWARGVLADLSHHDDDTLRAACRLIERESPDHCDRTTAQALLIVLKSPRG